MRQCETTSVLPTTILGWRLGAKSSASKPRWIIIGFQNEKAGDQHANSSISDHVNVSNINVMLNSDKYPL